jgi:hypothetical protein
MTRNSGSPSWLWLCCCCLQFLFATRGQSPSARRFQFALGGDGIGPPGQDPKFEFRLLTEQGYDFHVYVMI